MSETVVHIDWIQNRIVTGWGVAKDKTSPILPVIFVNEIPTELISNQLPRPDVKSAGWIENCGFQARVTSDIWEKLDDIVNVKVYQFDGEQLVLIAEKDIEISSDCDASISSLEEKTFLSETGTVAAVVCWDLSHNPAGRALVLYQILERIFDKVYLIGPVFTQHHDSLWGPIKSLDLNVLYKEVNTYDELVAFANSLKIECDFIWVCKPRLPSMLIADRLISPETKVYLDIDDHELSFYDRDEDIVEKDIVRRRHALKERPFAYELTKYVDQFLHLLPLKTVSNVMLKQEYGAEQIIRHARDENQFYYDPEMREQIRSKHNVLDTEFVVLFIGTPRHHKGLDHLTSVLEDLHKSLKHSPISPWTSIKLLIFGGDESSELGNKIASLDFAQMYPPFDFGELAPHLHLGDLICLFQDPASPISKFQLPSKISDAMSVGCPVVVSNNIPLNDFFLDYPDVKSIHIARYDIVKQIREIMQLGVRSVNEREIFEQEFSVAVAAEKLSQILNSSYKRDFQIMRDQIHNISQGSHGLLNGGKGIFSRSIPTQKASAELDVVLVWKQHDLGLFNRRVDSMISALSRDPNIGRILCIQPPIRLEELEEMSLDCSDFSTHKRLLTSNIISAHLRGLDNGKVSFRNFIYSDDQRYFMGSTLDKFNAYQQVFDAWVSECCTSSKKMLLFYPANFEVTAYVDEHEWDAVVADFVDDQRLFSDNINHRRNVLENYLRIGSASSLRIYNNAYTAEKIEELLSAQAHVGGAALTLENTFDWHAVKDALYVSEQMSLNNSDINNKIIGYVGNLRDRIDYELLTLIAQEGLEKGWTLQIIGPNIDPDECLKLVQYDNVSVIGAVTFPEAIKYIQYFSVGILPHINNDLSQNMHPLKIYQYLACEKPVVSTNIANLYQHQAVYVADTHRDFIGSIDKALAGSYSFNNVKQSDLWAEYVETILKETKLLA